MLSLTSETPREALEAATNNEHVSSMAQSLGKLTSKAFRRALVDRLRKPAWTLSYRRFIEIWTTLTA